MQTFKDGNGQTRQFRLTLHTVDLIRDLVRDAEDNPVDLLTIADEQFAEDDPQCLLQQLRTDRRLLCQVLHVAMNESAPQGVTYADFLKAMDGDGLENAADALGLEIIQLFPRHKRDTLRRLVEMHRELDQEIQKVVQGKDSALKNHLLEILRDPFLLEPSSGNSLENSESTPASSPTDSSSIWATPATSNAGTTPPNCSP